MNEVSDKFINVSISILLLICVILVGLVGWDFTHG